MTIIISFIYKTEDVQVNTIICINNKYLKN